MQKLYKKDSKGKLRIWQIRTEGSTIIEESGLAGGKLVTHKRECKPKNVGKSNETSGPEQASAEMRSKVREKLQEDYFKTSEEAMTTVILLPMLAKSYEKEAKKVKFPCYAQPKLDGMRALGSERLISRKGVTIETMGHILKSVSQISEVLDGELYAHGLSFQENMKLIKKYREGESEQVKYHVYDLVSDEDFITRYSKLIKISAEIPELVPVETVSLASEDELMSYHSENIAQGYEGTMVRWGDEGYKLNGRSSNLLKLKDFKDKACKVIDVVPMDARPEHGILVCKLGDKTFKATPKMSHEKRAYLLSNKDEFIGQMAEIRYFEDTDDGLPRFPVCVGFRLDK